MSSANVQIGVKLTGRLVSGSSLRETLRAIHGSIDYLEYPAPLLNVRKFARANDLSLKSLVPHSVYQSLSSKRTTSDALLSHLVEECRLTQVEYLGEHLGCLNQNENGPSFGYIIPPVLDDACCRTIARNVQRIEKACGVPLALENPVFYDVPKGSKLSWGEFLECLDSLLPKKTGWLVDLAHFNAAQSNCGFSFVGDLGFYRRSQRPVYEVHLAQVLVDEAGVFHDDHTSPLKTHALESLWSQVRELGSKPLRATLERKLQSPQDLEMLRADLSQLRKLSTRSMVQLPSRLPIKSKTAARVRRKAEADGRLSILTNLICAQFSWVASGDLQELSLLLGYRSFRNLVSAFRNDPWARHFRRSLPRFSAEENGAVDLTLPFFEFVRSRPNSHREMARAAVRKLLVGIATKQMAISAQAGRRSFDRMALRLKEPCGALPAGTFFLRIDKKDRLKARKVSSFSIRDRCIKGNRTFLFSEDGIRWKSKKRSLKIVPKSSSRSAFLALARTSASLRGTKYGRAGGAL